MDTFFHSDLCDFHFQYLLVIGHYFLNFHHTFVDLYLVIFELFRGHLLVMHVFHPLLGEIYLHFFIFGGLFLFFRHIFVDLSLTFVHNF